MAFGNKKEDRTYSYDPNVDYSELMDMAVRQGNYAQAATYEQQRNAKIQGEGLTQYQTSNQYAQYLPKENDVQAPKTNAQQMQDIMDRILSRENFHYDMDADALYQKYKDRYMKQGALAMEDTMGKAAALTGGYGNSYAQSVGQQAYNQHLDGLNDIVPELYAIAKDRYDAEGNALMNQYSLLADRENTEYSRNAAETEKAYNLALSMLQGGMMPSQAILDASGISAQDAQTIYDKANQPSYTGGGGPERKAKTISSYEGLSAEAKEIYDRIHANQRQIDDGQVYYDLTHPKAILEAILGGSINLQEGTYIGNALGYDFSSPAQVVMDLLNAGFISEAEATAMYNKFL